MATHRGKRSNPPRPDRTSTPGTAGRTGHPRSLAVKAFAVSLAALAMAPARAGAIDYVNDVTPILRKHCWKCHSREKSSVKGDLALDDLDAMRDDRIGPYSVIQPGKPANSSFLQAMKLEPRHSDFMPRKNPPVPADELAIIERWIAGGAIVDAKKPSEKEAAFLAAEKETPLDDERARFRAWTNSEGKSIEARFLRLSGNEVLLVTRNGKSYPVPLEKLSRESQALAKRLAEAD